MASAKSAVSRAPAEEEPMRLTRLPLAAVTAAVLGLAPPALAASPPPVAAAHGMVVTGPASGLGGRRRHAEARAATPSMRRLRSAMRWRSSTRRPATSAAAAS